MPVLILLLSIVFQLMPAQAHALEGLSRLQQMATGDENTECMVHEYTRRYNEVLRDYGKRHEPLTDAVESRAHEESLKWVRAVWAKANTSVVEKNIKSRAFQSAVTQFRRSQKEQYPDLKLVR